MNGFRYKHGDRPLEGYTVQRAAGRGGFGEVYYAVSDAGREVALKVILGGAQVEMRGVSQCMNLKSPHLVTIFDVKYNAEGVPFIIMEYVSGPTLRQLLDESPAGLSTQKVAFFLREIGKGLSYLHECGIVHRDLKPGNIFYENGTVKIGDYGLSKAITQSQHSAQTITVGTVHYMAPEIGMGRYDRSIDIYALGAVLFEMLTGQVPYLGASPAEVLMKHISSEPDLSSIEEPFASVIRKCMAKDPAQRYQTVQEVVEAVFGAEHVRNSVSVFRPESLSMVAQRVAQRIHMGGGSGTPMPAAPAPVIAPPADSWQPTEPIAPRPNRVKDLLPQAPAAPRANPRLVWRYIWTAIICIAAPLFAGFVAYANEHDVRGSEEGAVIGVCIGLAVLTLFGFLQLMLKLGNPPFRGWWREMYRPLALWACVQCFVIAAAYLGNSSYHYNERPRGGELVLLWFLIFFPVVLIPVLLTLRFEAPQDDSAAVRRAQAELKEAMARAKALESVKGEDQPMHAYRYKHGDRPLDGYTIHRAAGRGGFGEVYYALSDSGREVALKVIQGYEAIELRGVSQCMNLKSPHLVAIFDVKKNQDGVPFVIMEYVGGPSLRAIIDEAPGGLGTQKSAFFLREMAKGLTYLHDCGIVHRDLKPGNVFFEHGYVKIGDYGLSKAMSASQHSGQTVTVGTVHYMAPEIGVGRYDRSIDIYALGAVLYEMLTGQPPYLGASPGEILMKHMSATPDVTGIEEPFATVIRKAMAKDPAERYQTVQEMVEAVFGAEHVRNSVSVFRPDSLTMVAGKVAQHVGGGGGGVALGSSGPGAFSPQQTPPPSDLWTAASELMGRAGNRLGQIGNRVTELGVGVLPYEPRRKSGWWAPEPAEALDPIPRLHRRILGGLTVLVLSFASGLASGASDPAAAFFFCAFASVGSLLGLRLAQRLFLHRLRRESWVLQHLAVGGMAGVCAFLPSLFVLASIGGRFADQLFATFGAVAITFFILNWTQALTPDREQRVSLWYAAAAGVCGLVLAGMFGGSPPLAIGVLAAASLASQVVSPFAPPSVRRKAKAEARRAADAQGAALAEEQRVDAPPRRPHANVRPPGPNAPALTAGMPVPLFARWIWLGGVALFLSLGVILILAPAVGRFSDGEDAMFLGWGLGTLYLGFTCLFRSFTGTLHGWWGYLIKPLIRWLCVQSVCLAFFMLTVGGADNDEAIVALFFLVFPAVAMLLLVFTPGNEAVAAAAAPAPDPTKPEAKDASDHPAPPHAAPAPVVAPQMGSSLRSMISSPGEVVSSATRLVLAGTGYCTLIAAIVVGLIAAVDLPGFAGAGLIDWRVQRDIENGPGAGLLRTIAFIATYVGMFLATAMIVIARKRSGPLHMVRGFLACMGFLAAVNMLDNSMHGDWRQIVKNIPGAAVELAPPPPVEPVVRNRVEVEAPSATQAGAARVDSPSPRPVPPAATHRNVRTAAIEQYLNDTHSGMAVWSAVFSCMCLVLLLWTPRKPQFVSPVQSSTPATPEAKQWLTL